MTDLNRLTAAQAARDIAARKFSSEDLVKACLERIKLRDGAVQAFAFYDPDLAIAQARAADAGKRRGPLGGVPVGLKDVIDTRDMPTQYNSPIYRDHRPSVDSACAALTRAAGGIVLGKTVTTEFATRMPGPTRNPHNLDHTPGGSSSGSAASVADFMLPLAFGTQTGGSNIRPSAYCGIVGYKPSFGTINRAGLKSLAESLDTIGVMGRSVEDCALLVHAVSGRVQPDFAAKLPAPRIGLYRTPRWKDAEPAAQAALESAAATLTRAGALVRDIDLPADFTALYTSQMLIMNYEAARSFGDERFNHPDGLSEHLRTTLATAWDTPRADYEQAMMHAIACRNAFPGALADIDVLLTLSAPGEAPKGITSTGSSLFNRIWTVLGAPCVTVPHGRGPQGLPLAVQVVGRYNDDARTLVCAEWVRQALG